MDEDTLYGLIGQVEPGEAGELLRAYLRGVARDAIVKAMTAEVVALCGPRHARGEREKARYVRGGSAPASCVAEGRLEELRRPRVREKVGDKTREKELLSYAGFRDPEEVRRQILLCYAAGVSGRSMSGVLPGSPGTSKSEVSRLWQEYGRASLEELRSRDLRGAPFVLLLLDGIVLSEDLHAVAALGVLADGTKRFLDFEIGASENVEVCDALLSRLEARGFAPVPDTRLLVIEDGSKAIRSAVLKHWPDAAIQRCLVHKERNLRGYLPRKDHGELARLFNRLRRAEGAEAGELAFADLERFIGTKNKAAQESLREAGDDLLAVHRLNVPSTLNVSLLSTNAIENSYRNVRARTSRVKRWRPATDQAAHWLSWSLLEAEKGFRRIRGHADLPALIVALARPMRS